MFDFEKCPKCGNRVNWLAGTPAIDNNRYCDKCGWKAWKKDERITPNKKRL